MIVNRIKKFASDNKVVLTIAANIVVPVATVLVVDAIVKKLENNEN